MFQNLSHHIGFFQKATIDLCIHFWFECIEKRKRKWNWIKISFWFSWNVTSALWVSTLSCTWTAHLRALSHYNLSDCCCWWNPLRHYRQLHCLRHCFWLGSWRIWRDPLNDCDYSRPKSVLHHRSNRCRTYLSECLFCQWDAPSVDCSSQCFGYFVASQLVRRIFASIVMDFAFLFYWCNWWRCEFRWFCPAQIRRNNMDPFRWMCIYWAGRLYCCVRHRWVHVTPSAGRCQWRSTGISSHCDWITWPIGIAILSPNRTTASE